MEMQNFKPKSFWQRPEGVTGVLFLGSILAAAGYVFVNYLPTIMQLAENTLYLSVIQMDSA